MGTPFLSEIKIVSFNFPPKGWAQCDGQLLPINQNQALFSLLGTMYGGNGQTNFALPDFRGRVPVHIGGSHVQGERAGQEAHTVTIAEMPAHNHVINATSDAGGLALPGGNLLASTANQMYHLPNAGLTTLVANTIGNAGGSQPHENRQPYLVLEFIIALVGVFPSQN
jgi:microcystin-dependent protein